MPEREVIVEFPTVAGKDGNQKSVELQMLIEEIALSQGVRGALTSRIVRADEDTQDFGATLILALGTPAALALAKGVHDFISKYGDQVVIKTEEGAIIAHGSAASNIDVAATAAALRGVDVMKK